MDFRIIEFGVVFLLGFIFSRLNPNSKKYIKWYIILVLGLLFFESAFRDYHIGPDTYSYSQSYLIIEDLSWNDILQLMQQVYLKGVVVNVRDVGFLLFQKILSSLGLTFTGLLFVAGLLFFIPMGKLLYKYSDNIYSLILAFCLYISLFHIVALSGIRQQIVMGITYMIILLIPKRKFFIIGLLSVIAFTIHKTFPLFLLMLFLCFLVNKHIKKVHLLSLALAPLFLIAGSSIILFLASFSNDSYYAGYADDVAGGALTYILLAELISLFCYVAFRKVKLLNAEYLLLYSSLPLMTVFVPLVYVDGSMIRIGQYFTPFLLILLPKAICVAFKRYKNIVVIISSIMLIILALRSTYEYKFVW